MCHFIYSFNSLMRPMLLHSVTCAGALTSSRKEKVVSGKVFSDQKIGLEFFIEL